MSEAPTVAAGSPKLLELDKKDVEAVRSFLPGKVLGRTAPLLALVVLVLGFAGSLDVGLERFLGFPLEPRWLKYSVLIGLPVLIVGAQILAEWQAERKRKQAPALAVKVDAVPEGYFRIGPYLDTAEDRAKFARADRIHEKVLAWIKGADATPLYLTGDSGSGKSSAPLHCPNCAKPAGRSSRRAPGRTRRQRLAKRSRSWPRRKNGGWARRRLCAACSRPWRSARTRRFCLSSTSSRSSSYSRAQSARKPSQRSSTIFARSRSRASSCCSCCERLYDGDRRARPAASSPR